ncbi:Crp/Fnr family transcriptional regulator [Methylorubrum extorquens]|uniref:Crp/Fnr family transcriptional regulator n=1 Tax=Methylorubrum extorquens TaxID=408 RepID=UPI0022371E99|nr:Crp/Fnr family transcriptional regulator [Methylorubrum extorquens]UYW33148.1 Crp/Fnr family transcriptional regulator [Methylorubrum extorquens]
MDELHRPFVRKLDALAPLHAADKVALAAIEADAQHFPSGTDLIPDGGRAEGMIVLVEGYACRYKLRKNGRRQIIAYLVPGDVCDLDALGLDRMDHAIGTHSNCRVTRVEPNVVSDLRRRPAVAQALQTAARVDEARLRVWLVNLGCRSAVERLAHLFCELFMRLREVGLVNGNSYLLPVIQHDLADTTGMTPVHVNRSLGALRRAGLIARKGKHLTVLDLPRLMAVAEFDPGYLQLGSGRRMGEIASSWMESPI